MDATMETRTQAMVARRMPLGFRKERADSLRHVGAFCNISPEIHQRRQLKLKPPLCESQAS